MELDSWLEKLGQFDELFFVFNKSNCPGPIV